MLFIQLTLSLSDHTHTPRLPPQPTNQVWDSVLDTSRDMIRAVVACEHLIGGPIAARRLLDLTCAYGVLLEEFVTGESRELELRRLLLPTDLQALHAAPPGSNRPLVMTELIAEELVKTSRLHPEFEASPHFSRLLGFVDSLGAWLCWVAFVLALPFCIRD